LKTQALSNTSTDRLGLSVFLFSPPRHTGLVLQTYPPFQPGGYPRLLFGYSSIKDLLAAAYSQNQAAHLTGLSMECVFPAVLLSQPLEPVSISFRPESPLNPPSDSPAETYPISQALKGSTWAFDLQPICFPRTQTKLGVSVYLTNLSKLLPPWHRS
jgi:hypothetical protein